MTVVTVVTVLTVMTLATEMTVMTIVTVVTKKTVFINYKKFHKKNLISHQNLFTIKKTEITRKKNQKLFVKNSNCDELKNSNFDETQTQIVMKLKKQDCDKYQKLEL